ncbi:MAG: hypothetical protein ACRDWV_10525 [Acidimicrobiales bacterium]
MRTTRCILRTAAAGGFALGTTIALPMAAANAATNVVADGNFATPAVSGAGAYNEFCVNATPYCAAGNSTFGPWTVSSGSVDLNSAGLFPPPAGDPAGTQSVDLDGLNPGSMFESLSLAANTVYHGSFEVNYNVVPPRPGPSSSGSAPALTTTASATTRRPSTGG